MRIILSAFGFLLNLEPLLNLGRQLVHDGNQPIIAFPPNFESRAKNYGLESLAIGTAIELSDIERVAPGLNHPFGWLDHGWVTLPKHCSQLLELSRGADVLVGSPLDPACRIVHERISIPYASLHLSPFLEFSNAGRQLGASVVNPYRSRLGLPAVADPFGQDGGSRELALYAISSRVFDRPTHWLGHERIVGFLFGKQEWIAQADVMKFCATTDRLVVVAQGTLARSEWETTIQHAIGALSDVTCKTVLRGRSDESNPDSSSGDIGIFSSTPYSWLLARAALVVHSGDAAISAEAFRAGTPSVVLPQTPEERKWAEISASKACTRSVIPWSQLNVPRLSAAIRGTLLSGTAHQSAAQLADQIKTEDGVGTACQALKELAARDRSVGVQVDPELTPSGTNFLQPIKPTSTPLGRELEIPLSFSQQRLWFIDQLEPQNTGYNMTFGLRFHGEMNYPALHWAMSELIRRHQVLRTTFPARKGKPVQRVADGSDFRLEEIDLETLAAEEHGPELERTMRRELAQPFDLTAGPLLRMKLMRLGPQQHALIGSLHHIVCDGQSLAIMFSEIGHLYTAHCHNKLSSLPNLNVQYADFAIWQRNWLRGKLLSEQIEYWKKQLAGIPALELPTDYPRPAATSFRGGRRQWILSPQTAQKLKKFARQQGVTLFMTLVAAVQVLLSRYAGQDDISVGIPIAGRNRKEIENLMGCFVNTLVLRTDLAGNPDFNDVVQRVRKVGVEAYRHQDVPFERLVQELQPERDLTRTPFFQVFVGFQNVTEWKLELPGLEITQYLSLPESSKFDLMFDLMEWADGKIGGDISYASDLFHEETVAQIVRHLEMIIEQMVSKPMSRVHDFPLLTSLESQQLLYEWNRTDEEPSQLSVQQLFEQQVAKTPDQIAVADETQNLTYAELDRRAAGLASRLFDHGVARGEIVGLMSRRNVNFLVGMLAIWKVGAAYLPLDDKHPPERWQHLIERSKARWVVTELLFLDRIQSVLSKLEPDKAPMIVELDQTPSHPPKSFVSVVGMPKDLAYVIYTSGSTGVPKGVMIEQAGLVNHLLAMIRFLGLGPDDSMAQTASQSFDISVWQFVALLLVGGRTEIVPDSSVQDPILLWKEIKGRGISLVELVPSLLINLTLEARKERQMKSADSAMRLRWFLVTGEAVAPRACLDWVDIFPHIRLLNAYGPAECSDDVTLHEIEPGDQFPCERVPIGRPLTNTQAYVLDQHFMPAPVGVSGELCVGGIAVGRGYLNDPRRTAQAFVPDPFSGNEGGRLYRTGDIARYRKDGALEYIGRIDHQVKLRGYRIELGEIESTLLACSGVGEAIALVADDTETDDKRLVAYVVLDKGIEVKANVKELKEVLKRKLPPYMVPSMVVELERIPLTENGKVDRKALPKVEAMSGTTYVRPRTRTEEILAELWADVLKVEKVGAQGNFFDLGGHSLLGTQLMSRLHETFGTDLPLRALFEYPTLESQAGIVDEKLATSSPTWSGRIQPRNREQTRQLSFAQQRLWFLDQLEPGNASYNVAAAVRMEGALDVHALTRSLDEVVRRHEVLRTCFVIGEGAQPVQQLMEEVTFDLPMHIVQGESKATKLEEILRLAGDEAQKSFDLRSGPLLRAKLVHIEPQDHVVLLTMHHIVSDGWSMGVLISEISELYRAYSHSEIPKLDELTIQYADYSAWQRETLQGAIFEQQLSYWRTQLEGFGGILDLPTDHPRPPMQSHHGASFVFELGSELTEKLKDLARQQDVTLYMLLLAGFQVLLWKYSGQRDIAVGTPIANRERLETENLIGFFVNTLVMRVRVQEQKGFLQLLREVREVTLGAYAHQDVPFERLVEILKPQRDISRSPFFQVLFALQNVPSVKLELSGLKLSMLWGDLPVAKFDMSLKLDETDAGINATWEYNTDLFERETIARMAGCYQELLRQIVLEPECEIARLHVLSAEDRAQIVFAGNQNTVERVNKTLVTLFEEQVERTPHTDALVDEHRRMTYTELNCRANQLGHFLKSLGAGPEVRVGICLERSLQMIVGLLGILKSGAAYVPFDPDAPPARLDYMLRDAKAKILVTEKSLETRFLESTVQVIYVDADFANASDGTENVGAAMSEENLAYVIYTSGSTGTPKGVGVEHRQIVNYAKAICERLELRAGLSYATVSTLSADLGNTMVFPSLLNGGTLHVIASERMMDGKRLSEYFDYESIDCLKIVPSHLTGLHKTSPKNKLMPKRLLVVGGEASEWEWIKDWQACSPSCDVINHYGPTETTVGVLTFNAGAHKKREAAAVPLGEPLGNTYVYVLDENMGLTPTGAVGELYIGGAGVSRGYINSALLTADRFLPDPFSKNGARLYRSGDRVRRRPDGNLDFLGRIDNQVKIRGHRLELGEIEAALRQDPEVEQAVTVVRDRGDGKSLCAYVVRNKRSEEDDHVFKKKLQNSLKKRLPGYMVPEQVMVLDKLPLTSNGKIDWRGLPEPEQQSEPGGLRTSLFTPTQEILAVIWAGILKRNADSLEDNFFECGGHSLLAAQVIARSRELFQVEVPLRCLFESPSLGEFAAVIDEVKRVGNLKGRPPLVRMNRQQIIPLSYAQQRLWFLAQFTPEDSAYNVPRAVKIKGLLHLKAAQETLRALVHRHETLRTRFITTNGEPQQIVDAPEDFDLEVVDLQSLAEEERRSRVLSLAGKEARVQFDLQTGPLFRVKLVRLGEDEHVLLVTMPHIISDAWSAGILAREMAHLYAAFAQNHPMTLPELPVQYADFSIWQRNWLKGDVLEQQVSYWRNQLEDVSPLDLPTDHSRPALQSSRGAMFNFKLDTALAVRLQELARTEGATLYMVLLAALQILLSRYCRQEDIAIGSPIAGRTQVETEGLIGCFVNTLVLRSQVRRHETYIDLLRQVRETTLQAYANQEVSFERLVEELQPTRDLSRTPLFQVMFAMQNLESVEVEVPGLKLCFMDVENTESKFDLTLFINNSCDGLDAGVEYNTDLFTATTMQRMWSHWQTLLKSIVQRPNTRIGDLPILEDAGRFEVLEHLNATKHEYPGKSVIEIFEEQASKTPDSIAVCGGNEQLTYGDLTSRVRSLAPRLESSGVGPGCVVCLLMERDVDFLVGILAVWKAGGAYLPLNPKHPVAHSQKIIEQSGSHWILTKAPFAQALSSVLQPISSEQRPTVIDAKGTVQPLVRKQSSHRTELATTPKDLAYVIYTSGSTGVPKGVMIEHHAMLNHLHGKIRDLKLTKDDRVAQTASQSFDISVWQFVAALLVGGTVEIVPEEISVDPTALWDRVCEDEISVLELVPSFIATILSDSRKNREMKLRWMIATGEVVSPQICHDWLNRFPQVPLLNAYGPTECADDVTHYEVSQNAGVSGRVPIGQPLANIRVHILDDQVEPVPMGVHGELCIGGDCVGRGYLNDPVRTAEAFIPDPFSLQPGARLYKTGDLARYRDDGLIDYAGRFDQQVKLRGFRIELGAVEAALTYFPCVQRAVAVLQGDQGDNKLVAYVVLKNNSEPILSGKGLQEALRAKLPEYMVPAAVVEVDHIPLTSNGKINRKALPKVETVLENYIAPRDATEETLARQWREVLNVPNVGIDDNFFDLGGHSLLAVRVVSRITKDFRIAVPLVDFFRMPTIAQLSAYLKSRETKAGLVEKVATILNRVHELSPEQIRKELEGKKTVALSM